MKVQVRLFAAARERVGQGQLVHELPGGATVGDLAEDLFRLYPGLEKMRLQFAVNASYAKEDTVLRDSDEVACIPPVGGG